MTPIGKEEAAAALRASSFRIDDPDASEFGRVLIHSFAGFLGADWDESAAIALIAKATSIGWIDHLLGHNLLVVAPDWPRGVCFDVKRPEGEADEHQAGTG